MIFDIQKASVLKRVSAFLLDVILLCIAVVGFAFVLSTVTRYENTNNKLKDYYAKYETEYDTDFESYSDEMPEDEKERYMDAYNALISDKEAMRTYSLVVNLTLLITSLSIFFGYFVCEFIIPLILKNGQTVGKKVFGIAVIHTNSVRISSVALFIRTVLGKYTIETMFPVLIIIMIFFNSIGYVGLIVIGLLLILQIVMFFATGTRSFIHDLLSKTVTVDMASQLIFDTQEDRTEYIKKKHAETAAKQEYK